MSIKKQFLKSKPVCKATFTLPKNVAAGAENAVVIGEFNEWKKDEAVKMKKLKDGTFKVTIDLQSGKEYQFRYLLDNSKWENDPEADKYVATPYGTENSVVSVLN